MSDASRYLQPDYLVSVVHNAVIGLRDRISPSAYGRMYRAVRPYTMLGNARLRALHGAVEQVMRQGVPGDIVECGTARGGSAALMGLTLQRQRGDRKLWVFDTFEGLPSPTANDPDYEVARRYVGQCRGELEAVARLFVDLELSAFTQLVPGLFQDTLQHADISAIAVLHVDGDWYDSVMSCLTQLYDKVSPGGIIQIDDFGYWEGARKAVEEFFSMRRITVPLRHVDYAGRQFTKP